MRERGRPRTWEVCDEDCLVVQRVLYLLKLSPLGREVHQQSHGFGRNGDQSAFTMFTRGSKILMDGKRIQDQTVQRITFYLCGGCKRSQKGYVVPLLEAFIDGHPDVKVNLWIRDVVVRQVAAQAGGILLQHVPMVLPPPTLSEHLQVRHRTISLCFTFMEPVIPPLKSFAV